MGNEIVGDIWLRHLVMPGMPGSQLSMSLLHAQILTFHRRGHLIAFNDEFPRRRISQDIPLGKMPRCYARCLRCGCVAMVNDWVQAASYDDERRLEKVDEMAAKGYDVRVEFLQACKGGAYLEGLIEAGI